MIYLGNQAVGLNNVSKIQEQYELIYHATLQEEITNIIIDTDDNNNSFSLLGCIIAIQSTGAQNSTAEGYLKIALNSNQHNINRIVDITSGYRRANNTMSICCYLLPLEGLGHWGILTRQDNTSDFLSQDATEINRSIYTGSNIITGISNQKIINSIFIGSDITSNKFGIGSKIAIFGKRVEGGDT